MAGRSLTRLTAASVVPVGLGVVGFVALCVGLVVAVMDRAEIPLLAGGIALLVIALAFLSDSGEFKLGWGDASISIVRGVRKALDEATQSTEDAGEVRERIAEVSSALEAIEEVLGTERAVNRRRTLAQSLSESIARARLGAAAPVLPPTPWSDATTAHARRGDQVQLTIVYGDLTAEAVWCAVTDPAGEEHGTRVPATLELFETKAYSTTYPRDFPSADALTPGSYEVSWSKLRRGVSGEEIAGDAFEV